MNKQHLQLKNQSGKEMHFDAGRGMKPVEIEEKSPANYRIQKDKFYKSLIRFDQEMQVRRSRRTLDLPVHLEFIEVHFFMIFNDNKPYETKKKFKSYGLVPVLYRNFNQSVVFAIEDLERFKGFVNILEAFINSTDNQSPMKTAYAIATTIFDFEFLSSKKITGFCTEDVVISILNNTTEISKSFTWIYQSLVSYLEDLERKVEIRSFREHDGRMISVSGISHEDLMTIADNFDVVYKIQSIRSAVIQPDVFNTPELTWGFQASIPEKAVIIGVIDNGVRKIAPIQELILDSNLDITAQPPNPTHATKPHGTVVASMAALGEQIFDAQNQNPIADAFILPIKIITGDEGSFDVNAVKELLLNAIDQGVRIFNLSVLGPTINYNSSISEYAYMLDRLSYEHDILIFIAAGNLDAEDILAMHQPENDRTLHRYPNHYFNPNESSDVHVCEAMNICLPAESYNNITVGAIAENYNSESESSLTPDKSLPAYYSKKHYINVLAKVNGVWMKTSQKNSNVCKPDIVMPGGDRLDQQSGMRVLGFGDFADYYSFNSGTSLAAPLAANLAAKLVAKYEHVNMQSIKALILNSAEPTGDERIMDDLNLKLKHEQSLERYEMNYEDLNKEQKKQLNKLFSSESLYRNLIGFGRPNENQALFSNEKSVTLLLEDTIELRSHKTISLNLPTYLLNYSKKDAILKLEATLCYKFLPSWGNQLAYNPLHISFNFGNSYLQSEEKETAALYAKDEHEYFNRFYQSDFSAEEKTKARKQAKGIKKDLQAWSDEFYPPSNKPFSNAQKLNLNINKAELEKVQGQISLIVRCIGKENLDAETTNYLVDHAHPFSIAIKISEKITDELANFNLYDALIEINDLEGLSEGTATLDV